MIMTVLLFATHFFKRKNTYRFLFSTAISEGIKDLFQEMGYVSNGVDEKKDVDSDTGVDKAGTKITSAHG